MKTCNVEGCSQPVVTYHTRGRLQQRKQCQDHYRVMNRDAKRKARGNELPQHAPALRPGHYVLFDLPQRMVYVVNGNQRSVQPYPKATVNPHTIALLKLRKLDVLIIDALENAA